MSCSATKLLFGVVLFFSFFLSLSISSFGQVIRGANDCDFKIDYEVKKDEENNSHTISFKIESGLGLAEIKIADFRDSSKGVFDRKSIQLQDYSNGFVPTFHNLQPSTYLVQIIVPGKCFVGVNGMDGIEIKDN